MSTERPLPGKSLSQASATEALAEEARICSEAAHAEARRLHEETRSLVKKARHRMEVIHRRTEGDRATATEMLKDAEETHERLKSGSP